MNRNLFLLEKAVNFLSLLNQESIKPREAMSRLKLLLDQIPGEKIDLVWEVEEFDQSVHYDALVESAELGTISLSLCPTNSLPWPLRGVHRTKEANLVSVNNTAITVADTISYLDIVWSQTDIRERIVNSCIIHEYLERNPIKVTTLEIQEAMDSFRRTYHLYSAEETYRWLEKRGLDQTMFENIMEDSAKRTRLRQELTQNQVGAYFDSHFEDFERASIAQIIFNSPEEASSAVIKINTEKADLLTMAQDLFLKNGAAYPVLMEITRGYHDAEFASAVFNSKPGDIIGPIPVSDGYAVAHILRIESAILTDEIHEDIQSLLFESWLDEQRQKARIEWHWGKDEWFSDTANAKGSLRRL